MLSVAAYLNLLRTRPNFRRLWLAQIVSELGDWFYSIAIYSLLLELTGRAESVGLALVLQVLPQTFAGPIAGAVNDRISRKHVMIGADLARAAIVASMLLVRSPSVVWLVYPLLLLETIGAAFFEPARSAAIPNVVAENELTAANTLASVTWSLNLAIGTALGGIVGIWLGRDAIFIVNAASFLLSAFFIYRMKFAEPHAQRYGKLRTSDLLDFSPAREGIQYVRERRLWAAVLAKAGVAVLGTTWVLFPVMGGQAFSIAQVTGRPDPGGMLSMSILMSARGVGALLGPLVAAGWAGVQPRRLRLGITLGFVVGGIGYLIVAQAPNIVVAVAAIILAHTGGSNVWVFSTTLLQITTEDAYRGRVFAAELSLAMLALAIVAYGTGVALDAGVSARMIAALTGAGMFVPAGLWFLASRRFATAA